MKRAMGLVAAVLVIAVVANADRIAYSGGENGARTGQDYRSLALSIDTLQSSYLVKEPSTIALGADRNFGAPDYPERLIDDVSDRDLAYSGKTAENSVEFDSIRLRLNGFDGTQEDGRGEHLGILRSDPFRGAVAVDEAPEPATLLLMGVGFMVLAILKRRSALSADSSDRAR